jgi:hypothetical protein
MRLVRKGVGDGLDGGLLEDSGMSSMDQPMAVVDLVVVLAIVVFLLIVVVVKMMVAFVVVVVRHRYLTYQILHLCKTLLMVVLLLCSLFLTGVSCEGFALLFVIT